jgi:integrase
MLKVDDEIGMALDGPQVDKLLVECQRSCSRGLFPAVVIALSTAMRAGEIRTLRWKQIDFRLKALHVGMSKTRSGKGRVIPLNQLAMSVLGKYAADFRDRRPEHCIFPTERCAGQDSQGRLQYYDQNLIKPIGSWKKAWNAVRSRSGIHCRFHDLRHTAVTQMLRKGNTIAQIATVAGWSASTTILMIKKYGHLEGGMKKAVAALNWKRFPRNSPVALRRRLRSGKWSSNNQKEAKN